MKIFLGFAAIVLSAGMLCGADATSRPSQSSPQTTEPPIRVTLVSDGVTWVSIKNVRVPEQFQTKTVSLAPGTYEVIGRRRGFRDVERSLQVRSGEVPAKLTIICTETTRKS